MRIFLFFFLISVFLLFIFKHFTLTYECFFSSIDQINTLEMDLKEETVFFFGTHVLGAFYFLFFFFSSLKDDEMVPKIQTTLNMLISTYWGWTVKETNFF